MITVIIGTNAASNSTSAIAKAYVKALESHNVTYQLADLQYLPTDFIHSNMYHDRSESFEAFQSKYLFPTDKYIIILPEYNGGIPGIFKLMMDASDITKSWWHKKACLCGVAAGRAGNLRGLDNLTNILNYLKVDVLKNKLPISRINDFVNDNGLNDVDTINLIEEQVAEFIEF
jgi:NAD(P)H-dependent FMN reductase